ncbi:putative heavy metal tolerance protein [Coleophoma crateriformis]|uniref:Putative heavy metal tolerance protein n=1 Tax=Coleophoma crateriformis TaxID=565419 RepID=A0A3D8T828_9HELO|nr:putative heavy metal tolerance protein [Coleophoma crateriformis]
MAGEVELISNSSMLAVAEVLENTQFNYPWVILIIFLVAFTANSILSSESNDGSVTPTITGPGGKPLPRGALKSKQEKEKRKLQDFSPIRKLVFIWLSALLLGTFIASGTNVVAHAIAERDEGWWCGEATAIYVVGSTFVYILFIISLVDTTPSPTIAHQITWIICLIGELTIMISSVILYTSPHRDTNSLQSVHKEFRKRANDWEIIEVAVDALRVFLLILIVAFYTIFSLERSSKQKKDFRFAAALRAVGIAGSNETTPLLANGHANGSSYATTNVASENGALAENGNIPAPENGVAPGAATNGHAISGPVGPAESAAFYRPTEAPNRTWWEYLKGYSLFFPYLWPSKSLKLKLIVLVCFLLVVAQRAINILVPMQTGNVTNDLAGKNGAHGMPWLSISLLIVYKLLQGPSGFLGSARAALWIPISQYSYNSLTTASFEHVHSLSLDFHLGKRTGEVLSALSKGNAINNFLEQITFQVLPMLFDLGVAIGYFAIKFDAYYALVVSIIAFWYLYLTIRMAQWRAQQRREMVNADREEEAVKNDSIMSYETVKYFNAEPYEFQRYREAVKVYQKAEYKVLLSLNIMNITQNMVFMFGLLATSFIAAYQVTTGKREVGDFVTLLVYMAQLQGPLNFFGTFYRSIQSALISGERLLELFKEQPTVVDDPDAVAVPTCEGQIRFQNVKFSYDQRKPALENLSFTCRPGTTTALVGESGGGKSTVFRLLFRFYNTHDGSIQLDGNDIKGITIDSLRRHIGVVPQDTILFNETLMYNLRYANQDATDEDIYAACRAASIHDKIMAFPDGYDTKVGERGLRLSGGEKQRVAIARTIIKNPRIIMLDEATAALDSETEEHIQEALSTLSEGRTMLVIAHRLSTITKADQILVLHAGAVAESGTHEELLAKKGRYANMWKKQIRFERAEEEARVLSERADALRKQALLRPGSRDGATSEDVSENEGEIPSTVVTPEPGTLASRALGRAAEGLRGAASMVRGSRSPSGGDQRDLTSGQPANASRKHEDSTSSSDDDGKPAGHP